VLVALLVPAAPAAGVQERSAADVVLADFEPGDSQEGVSLAADVDRAVPSTDFAARGSGSLRFDIAGSAATGNTVFPRVWLEDGTALQRADWRTFGYLRVGVLNASSEPTTMYVVVRDLAGKFHQTGLSAAPYGYRVFQIATAAIAAQGVDLTRLQHIQISAARSPNPRRLYVDDVVGTDTLVDEAAEQARTATQVVASMGLSGRLDAAVEALGQVESRISPRQLPPEQALRGTAAAIRAQLDDYRGRIPGLGGDIGAARGILAGLETVRWRIPRLGSFVDARRARPQSPVGLGFAASMSLVYPRDLPCQCGWGDGRLQLARGEYESTQLVALPYGTGLSGAQVKVTGIAGPRGPGSGLTVTADPVASLNLAPPVAPRPGTPTPYRPSLYQGWTPDPILADRATVDVAGDDLQAFWIRVHAAPGAAAGDYEVTIELTARDTAPQRARVRVTVWDVVIADRPVLQTAIGNDPKAYAEPYGITDPEGVRKVNEAKWRFLADYKLQPDNIYRSIYDGRPPTVAELREIDSKYGGLRRFNIWYFDPRLFDRARPETWDAQADALFDTIQPYVEDYRAAGLADRAYLYCCDESRAEYFGLIKAVLTRFKQRFPDIEVMSTIIDDQMGTGSGLSRLVDYWVRDVPWHSAEIIADRRAAGDESWWYLHAGNQNPYPNLFVGYEPGQLRSLLGPMSYQAGVDGFLYYRVDRWYGHPVLTDGPLSNWDPRTWNDVAGDGSLFYPGRNGPLPSIRIENFRDGMEDHNLLAALRQAVDHAPGGTDPQLIAKAERLLTAHDVVTSQKSYVRDPATYQAWRGDLGRVLERLT
jgi:hypothetical protein